MTRECRRAAGRGSDCSESATPESRTVLLVDDEAGCLDAYLIFLAPGDGPASGRAAAVAPGAVQGSGPFFGYRFLLARCGASAVELVEREWNEGRRVACGFFDLKMPGGMDGAETIRRIREIDPDVACTIVTAHAGEGVRDVERLFGPERSDQWDLLAKPFTKWEIVQKCRHVVEAWNRKRREEHHLEEIERLNERLASWSSELEERVEERTRELTDAYRELSRSKDDLEQVLEQLASTQAKLVEQERIAGLGRLAVAVARQVEGPASSLRQSLDELERRMPAAGDDDGAVRESLATARRASEAVDRTVTGLRSFREPGPKPVPQDVNATLRAVVETTDFRSADVRLELGRLPSAAFAPGELEQAWRELLSNAVQAVAEGEGGSITIETRAWGSEIVVRIQDDGCGMDEETLERACEPFFTTRPRERANGLGLALASAVIRGRGGELALESALDQGTCCTVCLPELEDAGMD